MLFQNIMDQSVERDILDNVHLIYEHAFMYVCMYVS
jgi:hypothetical protein